MINHPNFKGCGILVVLLLLIMPGCKKDSNNSALKQSSLTSGTWTFQKFDYQKNDGTSIADPDAQDADRFTILFNPNATFFQVDQVNGFQSTGSWVISSDGSQLTLTGGEDEIFGTYQIIQLAQNSLVLTNTSYSLYSSIYKSIRLTFVR